MAGLPDNHTHPCAQQDVGIERTRTRGLTRFDNLRFHFGRDVAAHHREVLPHAVPQALDLGLHLGNLIIPLPGSAQRAAEGESEISQSLM